MMIVLRHVALAITFAAVAFGAAPAALAAPQCTDVGSTVTYCQTKGSTQLITTPPPWNWGGWQGIGFFPQGGFGYYP